MISNKKYDYLIVVDSCCELPEEYMSDPRFKRVPLELMIGDYSVTDTDDFDQLDFIKRVAESETAAKSACPSPSLYMDAYQTDAKRVYVVTLSSKLSGSYNSAVVAKDMYFEDIGEKQIHVIDSESASVGETQIAMLIMELEEQGNLTFDEIIDKAETLRNNMHTYFVLNTLDTFIKNGRISGIKALAVSTLNIKPVMAGDKGAIVQKGQGIGIKKALSRMADIAVNEVSDTAHKVLMISHCNAPERAESVKKLLLSKVPFAKVIILNMKGVSTMYANDGGIIVTC